jgi:hypothetical protein
MKKIDELLSEYNIDENNNSKLLQRIEEMKHLYQTTDKENKKFPSAPDNDVRNIGKHSSTNPKGGLSEHLSTTGLLGSRGDQNLKGGRS